MKYGSESSKTVGATSAVFVGVSPGRVALRVSAPAVGRVTLSTISPAVLDQGITLNQGDPPQYLCEDCVGHLIRSGWYAIADAAGRTIGVVEVIESPGQVGG